MASKLTMQTKPSLKMYAQSPFICQISETCVRVLKCQGKNGSKEFKAIELRTLSAGADDEALAKEVYTAFRNLGYNHEPVIIALGSNYATCRQQKIPAQSPDEMEKIVFLQASRYLPYPADELITAYEPLYHDQEGFSHLAMSIVHKDVIARYFLIFNALKPKALKIVLSPYGLLNLYAYLQPQDTGTAALIDFDAGNVELAIISKEKLYFSRYFKLNTKEENWQDILIDELQRTMDAYQKETGQEAPQKIVILGFDAMAENAAQALSEKSGSPFEICAYGSRINSEDKIRKKIKDSGVSYASLIGLALRDVAASLNFVPQELKEKMHRASYYKKVARLALVCLVSIFIFGLAAAKHLNNKEHYFLRLQDELSRITEEAAPLEEIQRWFQAYKSQKQKNMPILEMLAQFHRILPEQVSLVSLRYEEDSSISLIGQAQELNAVLEMVSGLENSPSFKDYTPKVRYATQKNTLQGETVDFEVMCVKK